MVKKILFKNAIESQVLRLQNSVLLIYLYYKFFYIDQLEGQFFLYFL
jgi:hypothetical protein